MKTKVRLTVDIELPYEADDWSDAELRTVLYDEVIGYTIHVRQDWLIGLRMSNLMDAAAAEHYKAWIERMKAAQWNFERIK